MSKVKKQISINKNHVKKQISELGCGDLFVGLDHSPNSNNGQPLPEDLCIVTMDMQGNYGYVEFESGNFYITKEGLDHLVCPVKDFSTQITLA
jgi:hypothetical protein